MTFVEVLCLNHGLNFGIIWTSDWKGEIRFDVCRAAKHRMFHFYGGMYKPYLFVWLYLRNNFTEIRKHVTKENERVSYPCSESLLEEFFNVWEFIVNEGFFPDFFIPLRYKEINGLSFEDLPKVQPPKENDISFQKLIENITIDKNPYFPEIDEKDFEKHEKEASIRTQACTNFQFLDRSQENNFLEKITQLQSSPILEQRWITLLALHFYLLSGFNDGKTLINLVKSNLLDDLYLIRRETLELLNTLFFIQPKVGLSFVRSLLEDKDVNCNLYGTRLLNKFWSLLRYEDEYNIIKIDRPKIKKDTTVIEEFFSLYQLGLEFQRKFLNQLLNKNSYWKMNENWEKVLTFEIKRRVEEEEEEDQFLDYEWALSRLRNLIREPFMEFSEISPSSKKRRRRKKKQ